PDAASHGHVGMDKHRKRDQRARKETNDGPSGRWGADRQDRTEGLRSPGQIGNGTDDSRSEGVHLCQVADRGCVINETRGNRHAARGIESLNDAEDLATETAGSDNEEGGGHALSLRLSLPRNSGIVASPTAAIPSRLATARTVSRIINRSPMKLWWSTYSTSSRNLSSQLNALRPET